jgi:hypothetical protein
LKAFVWATQIALGYIILFIVSVYVSEWTELGIGTDATYYSGWHLLGYAYSLTPTAGGVVMAIIITAIPPQINGYDPDRLNLYCQSLKDTVIFLLETLILCDPDHDFKTDHAKLKRAKWLGAREIFFASDINMLSWLPVYKLDPRLIPLLEHMKVTEIFISALIDGAAKAIKDDKLFFLEHRELFSVSVETLKEVKLPMRLDDAPKLKGRLASEENDAVVDILKTILYRFKKHEDTMESIRDARSQCCWLGRKNE